MTFDDINTGVLKTTLGRMEREFHTRDLSEHPDMQMAHGFDPRTPGHNTYVNYHAIIGRYLSAHRGELRLELLAYRDNRGRTNARWRKI